jgi:DNA polymerase-3 subunit delta'
MLLPTIRSRCLAHTMKWPEADEALTWLSGQGVPAPVAHTLLRSAGGRPTDVLRQAEAGLSPDWWAALPKAMRQGDARHLADLSPAQAIDALQKLCHDLVLRHSGAAPRFFDTNQLPPSNASVSVLTDWFKRLMQSARTAEHPFNAGLMLEALTADAQQTLMSKG